MTNSVFNDRRLPHDASLTDDPADVSTTSYPVMTTNDIVAGLVDRAVDPRSMMVPRHGGTDGFCSTCLLHPSQPLVGAPAGHAHAYTPVIGRTPGVHQRRGLGRTQNDGSPGEPTMQIDDPSLDDAEQRFRQKSRRWVGFKACEGPFA